MTSRLTLQAAPASGFDEPFQMLADCHERVRRMLALLQRLQVHLGTGAADDPARQAARDLMRYFDVAAVHHHADEEQHVLPLLRACAGEDMAALAERLHADHVTMGEYWAAMRPGLLALAEGRWAGPASAPRQFDVWQQFGLLYASHLTAEDEQAYPVARALADAALRAAMGREMAQRRGLPAS